MTLTAKQLNSRSKDTLIRYIGALQLRLKLREEGCTFNTKVLNSPNERDGKSTRNE
jgi:hypothetical protein